MRLWISKMLGLKSVSTGIDPSIIDNEMIMVIDFETTGLNVRKDYILEAAILPVYNRKLMISKTEYIKVQTPGYDPHSAPIHGILHSEAETPESEGLQRIASKLSRHWMIGHHVQFDYEILKNRCRVYQIDFFPKGFIDTQRMAVKLDTGANDLTGISSKDYTLQALCKRYSVPMEDEHTASGDTFAAALLFVKMMFKFKEKKLYLPAEKVIQNS